MDKIVSCYLLLSISDLLARLGNYKIFSSLDICSEYHHIRIKHEARPETVFATMNRKWHWNIASFGICSHPEIFPDLMSEVLKELDLFCIFR